MIVVKTALRRDPKEALKQLRPTSTCSPHRHPIPRTLQMAMSGLRELSTIQTPPVDRLAVRTYVMECDDRDCSALLREPSAAAELIVVLVRGHGGSRKLLRSMCLTQVRQRPRPMNPTEVEEWMSALRGRYECFFRPRSSKAGSIPPRQHSIIHRADRFACAMDHSRPSAVPSCAPMPPDHAQDTALNKCRERLNVERLDSSARFQLQATISTFAGPATCW